MSGSSAASPDGPVGWPARLAGRGLRLDFGAFAGRIQTRLPGVAGAIQTLYAGYPELTDASICDMHVHVDHVGVPLPRGGKRVQCAVDGVRPTDAAPESHGPVILEWGLNLAVAFRGQHLVLLHSGALERDGGALLLPAGPGVGKSTLTAALCHEGWRLLSDEFGLVDPATLHIQAMPRPVALKNDSIALIRRRYPESVLGPVMHGTPKGTVAHLRAPAASIARLHEDAAARMVVFPRWRAGAATRLEPLDPARALKHLVTNAFNYHVLGEIAFDTATRMIQDCSCYALEYDSLDEALAAIGEAFQAVS